MTSRCWRSIYFATTLKEAKNDDNIFMRLPWRHKIPLICFLHVLDAWIACRTNKFSITLARCGTIRTPGGGIQGLNVDGPAAVLVESGCLCLFCSVPDRHYSLFRQPQFPCASHHKRSKPQQQKRCRLGNVGDVDVKLATLNSLRKIQRFSISA